MRVGVPAGGVAKRTHIPTRVSNPIDLAVDAAKTSLDQRVENLRSAEPSLDVSVHVSLQQDLSESVWAPHTQKLWVLHLAKWMDGCGCK